MKKTDLDIITEIKKHIKKLTKEDKVRLNSMIDHMTCSGSCRTCPFKPGKECMVTRTLPGAGIAEVMKMAKLTLEAFNTCICRE